LKILLSRTDRIGDLILSTPAIATVRCSFPDAFVAMVASPYNEVVMERNDDVDELLVLPREIKAASFGARLRGYDIAIALAPRTIDWQLVGATGAPLRVGYTYERRWLARLTAPLFVNSLMVSEADPDLCDRFPQRIVRHEVVQLLDLVGLAGAHRRVERLRLDINDEDRAQTQDLPNEFVALHLGLRWFQSGSTLESTLTLVRQLAAIAPLVITCSRECEEMAAIFQRTGCVARVLYRLPFHQWAAVFERSRVIVTVDTGATHVASAVRRPLVVAFEHRYFRLNSQEWAPYGVPHALVQKPAFPDETSLALFRDEIVSGVTKLMNNA
jgi:ADP-heptose:LPS heptosyltransferase